MPQTLLDVHETIERGISWRVLYMTYTNDVGIGRNGLLSTLGISLRTAQRMEKHLDGKLPVGPSGRLWKFGEVLAKAKEIMGTQEAAVKWLQAPSIGLDQLQPMRLLTTPVGIKMAEALLLRIAARSVFVTPL